MNIFAITFIKFSRVINHVYHFILVTSFENIVEKATLATSREQISKPRMHVLF